MGLRNVFWNLELGLNELDWIVKIYCVIPLLKGFLNRKNKCFNARITVNQCKNLNYFFFGLGLEVKIVENLVINGVKLRVDVVHRYFFKQRNQLCVFFLDVLSIISSNQRYVLF